MKPVDLVGLHIEATSGAPLVLLREHDAPHRLLPIFVGGAEATAIAVALSGEAPPRPLTYDVMVELVEAVGARVDAVEVTALRDGAFLAELAVTGPRGDQRLDTRPSDAIALAVRLGTPLFVSEDVLDEAGTALAEEGDEPGESGVPDADTIDAVVNEFRTFLEELDPSDFDGPTTGGS